MRDGRGKAHERITRYGLMGRIGEEAGMTVDELEQAQEKVLPAEDLEPYRGMWVAIRDGRIIASDLDPVALRDNPEVQPTDTLTPVPAQRDGIYVL
jgi:hypothetical protein